MLTFHNPDMLFIKLYFANMPLFLIIYKTCGFKYVSMTQWFRRFSNVVRRRVKTAVSYNLACVCLVCLSFAFCSWLLSRLPSLCPVVQKSRANVGARSQRSTSPGRTTPTPYASTFQRWFITHHYVQHKIHFVFFSSKNIRQMLRLRYIFVSSSFRFKIYH